MLSLIGGEYNGEPLSAAISSRVTYYEYDLDADQSSLLAILHNILKVWTDTDSVRSSTPLAVLSYSLTFLEALDETYRGLVREAISKLISKGVVPIMCTGNDNSVSGIASIRNLEQIY